MNKYDLPLEEKVNPRHTALLVIDCQNDFLSPEGFVAKKRGKEELVFVENGVKTLASFIDQARKAGVLIIFVQAIYDRVFVSDIWLSIANTEEICLEGSWGADFYKGLEPYPTEIVVKKHRYSAFIGTDLDQILRSRRIKTLILAGVATNICVESTARDGFMLDYHIVFAKDCTATYVYMHNLHNSTLENIRTHFGIVVNSKEVVKAWRGRTQQLGVIPEPGRK